MTTRPIYFGPTGTPMLGWFHAPETVRRDVGILLCPPVGPDYACSYHLMRVLAELLEAAGFPTFRFDYPGVGDSSGSDADPDRVGAWLGGVGYAADELKRRSGCQALGVVGLRLGGLLAWHSVAGRPDVASFASWWGVGSGRKYVRNLRLYGLAATGSGTAAAGSDVESGGYVFSAETLDGLVQLDPATVTPVLRTRALFIQRDDQSLDDPLVERLRNQGHQVDCWSRGGIDAIAKTPHESTIPDPLLRELVSWLSASHPERAGSRGAADPMPGDFDILAQTTIPFEGTEVQETVVRFGPGLVGVVSHCDNRSRVTTGLLVLPGSSGHRVGTHRISVPLARESATRGYVALRFELGGNGDSPAPTGAPSNQPFPPHAAANVKAAVEVMRREYGLESVVVLGHCAGAWATYRAAVANAGADEYILLNWMNVDATPGGIAAKEDVVNYREAERLKGSVRSWEKWRRLLSGRTSPLKVGGIVMRRVRSAIARTLRPSHGRLAIDPGVGVEMIEILARARFTLIFSHALGPTYFRMQAGRLFDRLERDRGFRLVTLTSEDVGFGTTAVRHQLFGTLRDHLARRYPVEASVDG